MPTKEEILEKLKFMMQGKYSMIYTKPVIFGAMDIFAEQEAIGFIEWVSLNNLRLIVQKGRLVPYSELWQAYQSHKAAEALKIKEAMQTHDQLIKAKK